MRRFAGRKGETSTTRPGIARDAETCLQFLAALATTMAGDVSAGNHPTCEMLADAYEDVCGALRCDSLTGELVEDRDSGEGST